MADALEITARIIIPASDLSWSAVRASGPGGQNVNKVASKVELRFDAGNSRALSEETRARLIQLAGSRASLEGVIVIVAQDTRDQRRNLELARERLAELVRQALVRPKRRRPTKPSRAATARRLDAKKRQGDKKRSRQAGFD
ncbi:MAG: aminoacyl-tRNA hydrolase [Polyangiaceae bacterium]|nr:aminoacyl-tRNA hydrolase [Polyangiaceae bacterium]